MSDYFQYIIPVDPLFQSNETTLKQACDFLWFDVFGYTRTRIRRVKKTVEGQVVSERVFCLEIIPERKPAPPYDKMIHVKPFPHFWGIAGFVLCPNCQSEIDMDWWNGECDKIDANSVNLNCCLPCCGTTTHLNDLEYEPGGGWACWAIEIEGGEELDDLHKSELKKILGTQIRQVIVDY